MDHEIAILAEERWTRFLDDAVGIDKKHFLVLLDKMPRAELFKSPPGFGRVCQGDVIRSAAVSVGLDRWSGDLKKIEIFAASCNGNDCFGFARPGPNVSPEGECLAERQLSFAKLSIDCVVDSH